MGDARAFLARLLTILPLISFVLAVVCALVEFLTEGGNRRAGSWAVATAMWSWASYRTAPQLLKGLDR